jgi:hypothetical protein
MCPSRFFTLLYGNSCERPVVSISETGGDDMKRMVFAILLAISALTAVAAPAVWADSSDSNISTTEAP